MEKTRLSAFHASLITFVVFLAPVVLAPGGFALANVAGVAVALWFAIEVLRGYGSDAKGSTFAFRVRSVAPGLAAAAMLIFAVVIMCERSAFAAEAAADQLVDLWRFPFSPVAMFAAAQDGLPTASTEAVLRVAFAYTVAVAIGALFACLALFSKIDRTDSLHRHGLIWRGVKVPDPQERLAARGAKGLNAIVDPYTELTDQPVRPRLFIRAASLLFAFVLLSYAPVFTRIVAVSRIPVAEGLFDGGLANNPFFALWLTGMWGLTIAAALILMFAYLRLAAAMPR